MDELNIFESFSGEEVNHGRYFICAAGAGFFPGLLGHDRRVGPAEGVRA
jgi:hypothetical protein